MSNSLLSASTLAVEGGERLRKKPFAPWPWFEEDVINAAADTLRSGKVNYWTGDEGRRFETEYAAAVGCKYAVVVANGTVALELALHALGIGAGDEVIVASRTFIASASCAVMRGSVPVMVDVDAESQNITADAVQAAITNRTKAIIVVHLAGWPCDMDAILEVAREHRLKVVEDCAQAHGARYKGHAVGSMGDCNAFSFCQDKIMTLGGEGGVVATNDAELWARAWAYKDHGKSYEAVNNRKHPPGFRWRHESFGTNWRITEMQSAIGRALLPRLPAMVNRRRQHAAILTQRFSQMPALRVTVPPAQFFHSYYKYYVFLRPERLRSGWTRDRIIDAVKGEGIPCESGGCSEIYLEKAFPENMRPARRLPIAKQLGETSLMFLVHPTLSDGDMEDTANAVAKVLSHATR